MSFIEKISFENFRVFEEPFEMELKPITFLTGPNSSGKSSVLKSILLLKNNYTSSLQVLDFTGEKHNLGTFSNTLNKNCIGENQNESKDNFIRLGLTTKLKNGNPFGISLYKEPITTRRSVFYILREDSSNNEVTLNLNLYYRKFDRSGKIAKIELFCNEELKPFIILKIAKDDTENHILEINTNTIIKNEYLNELFVNYRITKEHKTIKNTKSSSIINKKYIMPSKFNIQEGNKEIFYDEPILVFSNLYKLFLEENFKGQINSKDMHSYFLKQPIKQILHDFSSILENTEYIEAVRANTKRLYTNDSQGTSFNELILDYNSRDIDAVSKKFINKWLKQFDIADEIRFDNIEGVATTIYLIDNQEKVALADLGYGITQFLPILLKVALEHPIKKRRSEEDIIVKKLILLEEPETNLHPKLQSLLADFIVDVIKTFEVRFIIETHSEYLIRRMQILINDGKLLKNNESNIYYFNNKKNDGQEKIIKINFLENGTLDKDFGDGFYDEATNLKFELVKRKANQ